MLAVATEVASRSNCLKVHVGAVITVEGRTRAVGYNGTVEEFPNCFDGGCVRCRDTSLGRGEDLDRCVCVHAEENAVASAARFGISLEGGDCWVTHEPCLQCTKLLIQARVARVIWLLPYDYDDRTDHEDSRRELRDSASTRMKLQFQHVPPEGKILAQLEERLEEFKARAKDYGRNRRIFMSSLRAPAAKRGSATSRGKSAHAARRSSGTTKRRRGRTPSRRA